MRDPAGELHNLLSAADFAERIGYCFSMLRGDERSEFVFAGIEQLAECEKICVRLCKRSVAPRWERVGRGRRLRSEHPRQSRAPPGPSRSLLPGLSRRPCSRNIRSCEHRDPMGDPVRSSVRHSDLPWVSVRRLAYGSPFSGVRGMDDWRAEDPEPLDLYLDDVASAEQPRRGAHVADALGSARRDDVAGCKVIV